MKISYTRNGDYQIPNIVIKKYRPIGHYGMLRKAFMQQFHPVLYNELVLSEKIYDHCAEIDEAARNRLEIIIPQLAKQYGVDEKLKAEDQMQWVGQMNTIRHQAEEIVKHELVYC